MAKMHKVTPLNSDIAVPGASEPYYPSFYIREIDLPAIKDKKIDDEFKVILKVKLKAIRKMKADDIEAEASILEIGLKGKDKKES